MTKLSIPAVTYSVTLIASVATAQTVPQDEQVIELYEAPTAIEKPSPVYPAVAARQRGEGWVELDFMVSPEGRAYEIYVVDHAGHDAFVGAATKALERTSFAPARIGGRPVDGSSSLRYTFVLEGVGNGSRRSFRSRYERVISRLADGSQTEAAEALADLEAEGILNHYEDAYLNLAHYSYALQYGTPTERMEFLRAALGETMANPDWDSVLGGDSAREARRSLLQLQLLNSYFGEAAQTFELMGLKGDTEGVELFRDAMEQLEVIRTADAAYQVPGRIEEDGSWLITLFKNRFHLSDLTGMVEELKLRCQKSYVFFDFDPELQYSVSKTAGECTLEVVGDPGTTFTLIQAR